MTRVAEVPAVVTPLAPTQSSKSNEVAGPDIEKPDRHKKAYEFHIIMSQEWPRVLTKLARMPNKTGKELDNIIA